MKNPSFLAGLACGLGISLLVLLGYSSVQSTNESAYLSCILSAEDGFAKALRSAELKGEVRLAEEWHTLTDAETAILFGKFENGPTFDCARYGYINEGRNDGTQRYSIHGRKVGQRVEVRLTNLGRVCRYQ